MILETILALAFATPQQGDFVDDWVVNEATRLTNPVQLTFGDRFIKAGEAYFSPDEKQVIFQAIEVPAEGAEAAAFYSMFVADLVTRDGKPALDNIRRVSPVGSANTCGWFDQTNPGTILFATTVTPPTQEETPGYQRGSGKYRWAFPREMRIVSAPITTDGDPSSLKAVVGEGKGYVAEGSLSPDGRWLVYCRIVDGDAQLFVLDRTTGKDLPLVTARGYDGGPFFSPCGKRICYRSDREGNDLLQLFVADLAFDESGAITGVAREHQLTRDDEAHAVNWAPFWTPDGKHLVYASSRVGHHNYEVFEIAVPEIGTAVPAADAPLPAPTRITHAPRADVLPVVSPSGSRLLWTSMRGPGTTSQVWIADFGPAQR